MIALLLVAILSIPLSTLALPVHSLRHLSLAVGCVISGIVLSLLAFASTSLGNIDFAASAGGLALVMAICSTVAAVAQRPATRALRGPPQVLAK